MAFKAPFFRYEDLRRHAEDFLSEYHPSGSVPIPIEKIVDLRLKIDIVPMPGFSNFDTVAYITPDLTEICVDEFVYNHRLNRYRFSLAHEIGHSVLRADIFKGFKFSDVASWKRFMTDDIPSE